jgi:tetratricopeptide (TPR) repeat protein
LLRETGRHDEAERAYRKALDIEEQLDPDNREFRLELGRICNNLALGLVEQKDFAQAKQFYDRALTIDRKLAADLPTVSDYQNALAITLVNVAIMHNHRAEYKDAIAILEEARPHHQAALKANPADSTYRECYHTNLRTLAWSHHGMTDHARLVATADELARFGFDPANETFYAAYYVRLSAEHAGKDGKLDTAARKQLTKSYGDRSLALLKEAVAFSDKEAVNHPTQSQYRENVAACYLDLAALLAKARWPNEAEAAYLGALGIQKQLADSFHDRPKFRLELARTHNSLGTLRFTTGRPLEAEAPYRDALKVWEQLVAENDSVPDYRNGLAGALVNLGMVQNQLRDFVAAVPFLEQARPHHEAALKARPKNSTYRLFYRNNVRTLAQSYLGLGDHGRLATSADEMAHFGFDPANDSFLAACFVSRCVLLADKDSKLAEDTRKELKDRYAERALELLRQAVDRGYRSAAHMKAEPDLEPLRGREEFKKVIAELEMKK